MNEHRFSTVLLFLALAILGYFTIPRLAFNFGADHRSPIITISYSYPYAPPEQIERTLTTPIEAGIALIDGIDKSKSVISNGHGYTRIELDKGASMDLVRFQLAQMLRQLYSGFPLDAGYPQITVNDPDEKEIDPTILSYSLHGPGDLHEIFRYGQEQLVPQFADLPGLQRVDVEGSNRLEYHLTYNEALLESSGLQRRQVESIIRQHYEQSGFSRVFYRGRYLHAKLAQKDIRDLLSMPISLPLSGSLQLGQLVTLTKVEERKNRFYRVNGLESIRLNFVPSEGSNHLDLARRIKDRVLTLLPTLPAGLDMYLDYDETSYINTELNKIRDRTVWSIGLLILFVFLAYRSVKGGLILLFAMMVNLGIAILFYQLLDVQLNLYALAGITVSLGIILDNIIVMSHHVRRHQDRSVFPALLTATLTTLSALIVIFMLPDSLKLELIDFAKVLGINLGISLLIAYLLIPALEGSILNNKSLSAAPLRRPGRILIKLNQTYNYTIFQLRKFRKAAILGVVLLFGLPVFWLPNQIGGWEWYNRSLGSDHYIENIKPWTNRILGGTLRLFTRYVYESSGFRTTDETILYVSASLPMGSTIEQMNDLMSQMEAYLGQYKADIKNYLTTVTSGQYGQIRIYFPPGGVPTFSYILKSRLESFAIDLGGVEWNIYGVGRGFSSGSGASVASFRVMMKGYNKDQLDKYADEMANVLLSHPRISEVNTDANINWWEEDRYEFVLDIDKEQMQQHKVSWLDIEGILAGHNQLAAVAGYTPQNEAIRLKSNLLHENDLWSLNNQLFRRDSMRFAFASFGSLVKQQVANSIHKEDQQYLQMLEFEYTGSFRFGQRYLDECMMATQNSLPLGYSVEQHNRSFLGDQAKKQYGMIALIVIIIFFICAIHFESFFTPVIIILLIPLSCIGIFLTFYWFDFPFDQGGYTSFLLLSGIVVNSLIIIFSDYRRLIRQWPKRCKIDLYLRAFRQKITPIYLTILSTALGLLPFTFHGDQEVFWFPLAVGTIGGLLFSLVVILFFVPLFISKTSGK